MANIRTNFRSFTGGEISPSMHGRIDDPKYAVGVAKLTNFIVSSNGDIFNRSGFGFIDEVPESTPISLIPYARSIGVGDWFLLEISPSGNVRIIQGGAVVQHKAPVAYTGNTVFQTGDVVAYQGRNYYRNSLIPPSGLQSPPTANTSNAYWFLQPISGDLTLNLHVSTIAPMTLLSANYAQYGDILSIVSPELPVPTNISYNKRGGALVPSWGCEYPIFAGFGYDVSSPRTVTAIAVGNPDTKYKYKYKVTATRNPGYYGFGESKAGSAPEVAGNIVAENASNLISWIAPIVGGSGATYRVYREVNGIYGFIGETTELSLIDNNLAPDSSRPVSSYDTDVPSLTEGFNAVGFFEQRKVYGGTVSAPQTLIASRPGFSDDFGYTIPTRDDNRIKIAMNSRTLGTIRHIIPMNELIVLTDNAEWRLSPIDNTAGGALTPFLSARPQSYVGSSPVYPVVVDNRIIFCTAEGGHIRELGYVRDANGYITNDISLGAAHFFDGYAITSMCLTKTPNPLIFATSSSGKMLGLTYVPSDNITAWHEHETNGQFLRVASIREGLEDVVYALIRRYPQGHPNGIVYLEYMKKRCTDLHKCFFMDSSLHRDGNNTNPANTVTITVTNVPSIGDVITVTANHNAFIVGDNSTDIGDLIILLDNQNTIPDIELRIERVISATSVIVSSPRVIPVNFRNTALNAFSIARNTFTGLGHLEGMTVSIIGDKAVFPSVKVVNGSITLNRPCINVYAGLPYESRVTTLPLVIPQLDGSGQGRTKNVNIAWIRLLNSSSVWVGPKNGKLVEMKQRTDEPYGEPPRLMTGEFMVELFPDWSEDGSITLVQTSPLPVNILAITTSTALGG